MLPVLPRKRLSFVPLTQVFVLMQHFLPLHRTQRLSILCRPQVLIKNCAIVLLRCLVLAPHPPTHLPYQILANQILRDCFDGALISNPTRAAIVGHADAGPAYIEGELKGQTWKMYMCVWVSSCLSMFLSSTQFRLLELTDIPTPPHTLTIGNRANAPIGFLAFELDLRDEKVNKYLLWHLSSLAGILPSTCKI